MKKATVTLMTTTLLLTWAISGCARGDEPGLPNPASVYCEEHGGTVDLREGEGGVSGYCIFPDGSECEEWAFFNGECAPTMIEIDCDAFYDMPNQVKSIEVGEGDTFTITLCSNPTTGYIWGEDAEVSSAEVVRQDHQEFNAPGEGGDAPVVGAPGTHTWTFTALQAGECVITLAYSQPWEGGEKNAWTLTLTVVVK